MSDDYTKNFYIKHIQSRKPSDGVNRIFQLVRIIIFTSHIILTLYHGSVQKF